jgi:hypothetical protein
MEIAHLLTQEVTVKSREVDGDGRPVLDATGSPSFEEARTVACRVERTQGVAPEGGGTKDAATFTLVTTEEILPTDLVWLPGTDTSDEAAARSPGPSGVQPAVRLRGSATLFYQTVL